VLQVLMNLPHSGVASVQSLPETPSACRLLSATASIRFAFKEIRVSSHHPIEIRAGAACFSWQRNTRPVKARQVFFPGPFVLDSCYSSNAVLYSAHGTSRVCTQYWRSLFSQIPPRFLPEASQGGAAWPCRGPSDSPLDCQKPKNSR